MAISNEVLDELIKDYQSPEDLLGENGLLKQLTKALLERAMNAELTHELGFAKNDKSSLKENSNRRNGTSVKTIKSKHGEIELAIPRDRHAEFEPQIIKKHQRRFEEFDDLILSLYSRGLSTREIKAHIAEIYGRGSFADAGFNRHRQCFGTGQRMADAPVGDGLPDCLSGCFAGQSED